MQQRQKVETLDLQPFFYSFVVSNMRHFSFPKKILTFFWHTKDMRHFSFPKRKVAKKKKAVQAKLKNKFSALVLNFIESRGETDKILNGQSLQFMVLNFTGRRQG